jgi:hypothetical protein
MPSEPKANILLVDDNPANLLSLRALLDADRRRTAAAGFNHHLVTPPGPKAWTACSPHYPSATH